MNDNAAENEKTIDVVRQIRDALTKYEGPYLLGIAQDEEPNADAETKALVDSWIDSQGRDFVLKTLILDSPSKDGSGRTRREVAAERTEPTMWMTSNLPAPEHTHEPTTEPVDGCTRCELEQGNRRALVDLIDQAGPDFVVRTIDELAGFPDNGMTAPATISESFHENDAPSLADQVADRLSPASLLGFGADEYDADDDQHRMIKAARSKLDLGLDRAIDGVNLIREAIDELVSNSVYDIEYAEGREGDDMRAHLETAAREIRAAGRIAESVNRR